MASTRWTPLYEEELVVIARPARPAGRAPGAGEQPLPAFRPHPAHGAAIDRLLRRLAVPLNEFLELNAIETLIELVRQEVGVTLLPLINGSNWQQSPQLRILPLPADLGPSARAIGMLERREHARQGITAAICAACHAAFEARAAQTREANTPAHGPMDRAPASAWTGARRLRCPSRDRTSRACRFPPGRRSGADRPDLRSA